MLILVVLGLYNILPLTNCHETEKYNITSAGCEHPFQSINDGCYMFSEVQMDFNEAISYCESLSYGHVKKITIAMLDYSNEEDQALLDAIAEDGKTFWVGGKTEDNIQWHWVDNRLINLNANFWDWFEPGTDGNRCIVGQSNTHHDGNRAFLYDQDCSDSMNFICQTGNINCPANFIEVENYCYLQSWTIGLPELSWESAREYCTSLDAPNGYHADLAVIGNKDQDDYNLMYTISVIGIDDIWIGARAYGDDAECHYEWTDGRQLNSESILWFYSPSGCASTNGVRIYHDKSDRTMIRTSNSEIVLPFICQLFKDI